MTTDWIDAAIAKATRPEPAREVIPGRYPFTYAYDFVRGHASVFEDEAPGPWTSLLRDGFIASRADTAGWLRRETGTSGSTDPAYVAVCRRIADAAIEAEGLVWPDGVTPDSVIAERAVIQPDGSYAWVGPTARATADGHC